MNHAAGAAVGVGDVAPAFALPDWAGARHESADYLGAALVVVLTRHVH